MLFIITTTITKGPQQETSERKPAFQWLGLHTGYTIMIDDNPEFTTPLTAEVEGNTFIPEENLGLGQHYWKVKGLRESGIKTFTIISEVSIKKEQDNLRNDGNTKLIIEKSPSITGAVILDINRTIKLEKDVEEVLAKQDE